ncbi:MAG: 3'-5' exonuclease [Muribaculaceae bacterium]|nr:3'-5' exonuclease [Muribaculaceae bacterium]
MAREINLKRPLIFFDLETTGLNITQDRIVEISMIKLNPDGTVIEKTRRVNPERPIPAEATAVHHITDDDVKNEPTFRQIARSLEQFIAGCDFAGFNSNRFDVPMLSEEFFRAGISVNFRKAHFIDVQTIFHKKEQRTLSAAYRFYCDKDLEGAHSAAADTRATVEILKAQLDRYADLPNDIEELSRYSTQNRNVDLMGRLVYNDKGEIVINFGKYKGRVAEEVLSTDTGFYSWICQADFSQDTKNAFTNVMLSAKEKKKGNAKR